MNLYCINLDHRKDRWERMQKKFAGLNLIRVPAVQHKNGWRGLIYSNMFLMQNIITKPERHPIIVLEDDCLLLDPPDIFQKRFAQYIDYLMKHQGEWDMFSGGGIYLKPHKIICRDPMIVECVWSVCTQFIVHSDQSAAEIISWGRRPNTWKQSIDTYLATKFNRIWLPYPMLCIQELGDSDINKKPGYKNEIDRAFQEAVKTLDHFVREHA